MKIRISTPLTKEKVMTLHSGDEVLLSGVIYTSRDAGHKRLVEAHQKGEALPADLKDATIFFVGPTPAKPGQALGSCGPTTSYRMDAYSPYLIRQCGLTGMIGKGKRFRIAEHDIGERLEMADTHVASPDMIRMLENVPRQAARSAAPSRRNSCRMRVARVSGSRSSSIEAQ